MVLYFPFGALGGFITIPLGFLATKNGITIGDAALLNVAQYLTSWMKWLWAPIVDITLTPKRWYVISTVLSALFIVLMSAIPLVESTLNVMLAVIATASLVNSVVGMAVEALMSQATAPEEVGRVSGWFQAGNLGGNGVGGGIALILIQETGRSWIAGVLLGVLFLACCLALYAVPSFAPHRAEGGPLRAVREVVRDLWLMLKTKGGLLSAILCLMPVSTGAAQGILVQSKVAEFWGATDWHVALVQGLLAGAITSAGCFVGGYLCNRMAPRTAYALIGVALALIASGMAISPATVKMYVVWSMTYSFGVGLAYAAFTAVVLSCMGAGSGATKYNTFASLSNFPLWWLGWVLGQVAEKHGPRAMLLAEAGFGVVGIGIFVLSVWRVRRSSLPA